MGPLVALLGFVGAIIAWAYFAWQPPYANKKQLSVFNWSVMAAMVMICISWIANMSVWLSDDSVEKFRVSFAAGGAIGIEIVFLSFMFVVRNYWIFKPPRQGRR